MDVPSVIREVDAWPVEDRMLLVQQELWIVWSIKVTSRRSGRI